MIRVKISFAKVMTTPPARVRKPFALWDGSWDLRERPICTIPKYSTVTEHMPQEHQKYLEWNGDRFRKWADSIGINTSKVVDAILTSGRVEQQSYRSCMGLLKLAEKYSPEKLEQICAKALSYSAKPSYKSIQNLLAAMKDSSDDISNASKESQTVEKPHGITRGARYYGGKRS